MGSWKDNDFLTGKIIELVSISALNSQELYHHCTITRTNTKYYHCIYSLGSYIFRSDAKF